MKTESPLGQAPHDNVTPLTRAERVRHAMRTLDNCADHLEAWREHLGEDLYAQMLSQAYGYAQFLTECKQSGLDPVDPRLRNVTQEIVQFCEFVHETLPIE